MLQHTLYKCKLRRRAWPAGSVARPAGSALAQRRLRLAQHVSQRLHILHLVHIRLQQAALRQALPQHCHYMVI